MKKSNKSYKLFCILVVLILLSAGILIGCGGGSSNITSVSLNTPLPNPTRNIDTVPTQEVLSTVTETSTNSSTVSSNTGGEINHDNVKVEIPPNALAQNSEINISTVSIQDKTGRLYSSSENAPIYKICTNSKETIELSKPAKIKIQIDPLVVTPHLAFWSGEEWMPLDKEYVTFDSNTHTLTFQLKRIHNNSNEFIKTGDMILNATTIVTYWPTWDGHTYPYRFVSSNNHFSIHYDTNSSQQYAESIAGGLESCYNYFNQLGFNSPITFDFWENGQEYTSNKSMIYLKYDNTSTGWASTQGYILLPTSVDQSIRIRGVSYHELFHLVHFSYRFNPKWYIESMADIMGYSATNHIDDITNPTKYDIKWDYGYLHWRGANNFKYTLQGDGDFKEYDSNVFWAPVIHIYGINKVRDILSSTSGESSDITLQTLDTKFNSIIGNSLPNVYFNDFEDYYIYGQVYNKTYFNSLPERDTNEPLCAPNSGYSTDYNYEAFNSSNNPYYNGSAVTVEHLSGQCYNFNARGQTGSLSLTLSTPDASNLKVKIFSFRNNNGVFEFVNTQEFSNQNLDNKLIPYSNGVTDITVLLENSSLTNDNNLTLKAYGTTAIPGIDVSITSIIPSNTSTIKIDVTKVANNSLVKSVFIPKPASSAIWTTNISGLPLNEKLRFEFSALDTQNKVLSHRIEYRIIPQDGNLALNPTLGVTIRSNGTFYPSNIIVTASLMGLPPVEVVWGNDDSGSTSNLSFTVNDAPVSIPAIAQRNPNAIPFETAQSFGSYIIPRRTIIGNDPGGTHGIYVTNNVTNLSGNIINTTHMLISIEKGNVSIPVTKEDK